MKYIVTIFILLSIASQQLLSQSGSQIQIQIEHEFLSDLGSLSVWDEYESHQGVGISVVMENSQSLNWFLNYRFSQANPKNKLAVFSMVEEQNPDYVVFSNNHLNFNSIAFGFQKSFIKRGPLNLDLLVDVGYNLASKSKILGYQSDGWLDYSEVELSPTEFEHGLRSDISLGSQVQLNQNLSFVLRGGGCLIGMINKGNNKPTLSAFLQVETGITVKI